MQGLTVVGVDRCFDGKAKIGWLRDLVASWLDSCLKGVQNAQTARHGAGPLGRHSNGEQRGFQQSDQSTIRVHSALTNSSLVLAGHHLDIRLCSLIDDVIEKIDRAKLEIISESSQEPVSP